MKPVYVIILFLLILSTGFAFSQIYGNILPKIVNPNEAEIISYCNDSVAIAPKITTQSIKIEEPSEGMKISIANYRSGEDTLVWEKVHYIEDIWQDCFGIFVIKQLANLKNISKLNEVLYIFIY